MSQRKFLAQLLYCTKRDCGKPAVANFSMSGQFFLKREAVRDKDRVGKEESSAWRISARPVSFPRWVRVGKSVLTDKHIPIKSLLRSRNDLFSAPAPATVIYCPLNCSIPSCTIK